MEFEEKCEILEGGGIHPFNSPLPPSSNNRTEWKNKEGIIINDIESKKIKI